MEEVKTSSTVRFLVQESRLLNAFEDRILSRKVVKKDAVCLIALNKEKVLSQNDYSESQEAAPS